MNRPSRDFYSPYAMSEVSFSDSLNRFKESFLWAAAQGGNTEDCESLLEIGAEVDWKNTDGDTALLAACRRGHADTVVLLLVYGASPNARGKDGLTPLHICARNADIKTLNVLLDAGADALLQTPDSHTALALAQQKGYENVVRRLTGDDSESMVPSVTIRETPSEQVRQTVRCINAALVVVCDLILLRLCSDRPWPRRGLPAAGATRPRRETRGCP